MAGQTAQHTAQQRAQRAAAVRGPRTLGRSLSRVECALGGVVSWQLALGRMQEAVSGSTYRIMAQKHPGSWACIKLRKLCWSGMHQIAEHSCKTSTASHSTSCAGAGIQRFDKDGMACIITEAFTSP